MGFIRRGLARLAFLAGCAVFLFSSVNPAYPASLEFHMIDVGQGDAMFFKMPDGEVVMIDGGPADAEDRVARYLRSSGVRSIDLLIATHPHEDHIGGLTKVIGEFPVSLVWDPGFNLGTATQRNFLRSVQKSEARLQIAKAGLSRKFGEAEVRVLAPADKSGKPGKDANDSSIVASVTWRRISFLLTGDAERADRKTIGGYPRSTVLKVAHHGSSGGTTKALLRRVRPQIAVVSYGEGNSYGHPHRETLKALAESNVRLYSTADGDIVITSDGEGFSVNHDGAEAAGRDNQ